MMMNDVSLGAGHTARIPVLGRVWRATRIGGSCVPRRVGGQPPLAAASHRHRLHARYALSLLALIFSLLLRYIR
jgi:hypothetical protein